MTRYLATSAAAHILILAALLFSPLFNRGPDLLMIDGFEWMGEGGGSGTGGGGGGGLTKEQVGQPVPNPAKIPIPDKPAPVQTAKAGEETWQLKDAKTKEPVKKAAPPAEEALERAPKAQPAQSNVIRLPGAVAQGPGVGGTATGFDFGPGDGGSGKGVGVGVGPGEGGGFGFGSYLKILRQRIWDEWTQSSVYGSNEVCVIALTVGRSGEVSNVLVEKKSGNSFYDEVATRAVRNASPLPPLPSSFPKSEQRFRIQFRLVE